MIHPLYIMALVTTVAALAVWGMLLWQMSPGDERRRGLLLMVVFGVFMSPLAYWGLRQPLLLGMLEPVLNQPSWDAGIWPFVRGVIRLAYAPLTEEPAKLLPWWLLLGCGVRVRPIREMFAPLALAAGLGFAVGEIWLVAKLVVAANDPQLAALPWYGFGGFLTERLLTCLSHTLFCFPTIALSAGGRMRGAVGLALGMALHWLGNSPIALMRVQAFGWSAGTWSAIVQLWVLAFAIAGLVTLIGFYAGKESFRSIWAQHMICPGCGARYRQPILLGLNFGLYRYERCGACGKWHWVTLQDLAPARQSSAAAGEQPSQLNES